jgi:hypothetical protein
VTDAVTPANIFNLGLGFWASKTLLSAVELGLFTELAKGPADLAALARRLGLHDRSARDFLDALVALKLLDRQNGQYSNTAETDLFLDRAKPSYVGGFLEMANARLYEHWSSLTEALKTGRNQNEAKGSGARALCRSGPFARVPRRHERSQPRHSPGDRREISVAGL